jgi:hypothetical protein
MAIARVAGCITFLAVFLLAPLSQAASIATYNFSAIITSNFGRIFDDAVGTIVTGSVSYIPTPASPSKDEFFLNSLIDISLRGHSIPKTGGSNVQALNNFFRIPGHPQFTDGFAFVAQGTPGPAYESLSLNLVFDFSDIIDATELPDASTSLSNFSFGYVNYVRYTPSTGNYGFEADLLSFTQPAPLPSSLPLFASGLAALVFIRRRRSKIARMSEA